FEEHSFRFWNEEPGEYEHQNRERSEEKEGPVAIRPKSRKHVWRGPCNNEVEKPLCRSSNRNIQRAKSQGRDLCDVDPWNRAPAELEEDRGKVDAYECDVSCRRQRLTIYGRTYAEVKTDVE